MHDKADARILIVDDDVEVVAVLHRTLARAGYLQVQSTNDPFSAAELFREVEPDLMVLDLSMPGCDGFKVMAQVRRMYPEEQVLPILVLSGETSAVLRRRALAEGAADLVGKPCDVSEFTLRVHNLLETRALHRRLELQNRALEARVLERTRELEQTQAEMLQRLATAAEARDDSTGRHTQRVGLLSASLARALGESEERVALMRRAAPLHDVGKIAVPDRVLLKPGKLTPEEFEAMKQHTVAGARMLKDGNCPLLTMAERIARSHHERWDGTGYPDALEGEAIPVEARIVAVADLFDALSHDRPYRPAWAMDRILEHLKAGRGRHFEPEVVDAFLGPAMTRARAGGATVGAPHASSVLAA